MNDIDAKRIAQLAAREYTRGRWAGRAKNGKGRLFPAGGVAFVCAQLGIEQVRAFEIEAREMWDSFKKEGK